MPTSQSNEVLQLLLKRFDGIDERLANQDLVLSKQNIAMTRIEQQTTLTNGRVNSLEEANKLKIKNAIESTLAKRWWLEIIVKLAPWVAMILSVFLFKRT